MVVVAAANARGATTVAAAGGNLIQKVHGRRAGDFVGAGAEAPILHLGISEHPFWVRNVRDHLFTVRGRHKDARDNHAGDETNEHPHDVEHCLRPRVL